MEAVGYFELLVPLYQITRRHIPEDRNPKNYFALTREEISPLPFVCSKVGGCGDPQSSGGWGVDIEQSQAAPGELHCYVTQAHKGTILNPNSVVKDRTGFNGKTLFTYFTASLSTCLQLCRHAVLRR
jgi:hypothetical protein